MAGWRCSPIYAFAFQIYCDFSGYTDAARGIAKCLGFELTLNFNLPYFATSPQDFWSRWHISLSTWLRDYLYIPLGRQSRRQAAALPQPDADDGPRRPLARRGLDLCPLGLSTRGSCWSGTGCLSPWLERIDPPIRSTAPAGRACGSSSRSTSVCLGWLIFRAESIEQVTGHARGDRPPSGDPGGVLPGASDGR